MPSPRTLQQATPPPTLAGKVSEVVLGGGQQQKMEKSQVVEDFVWDGSWAFKEGWEEYNRWETSYVKDKADFIISVKVFKAICEGIRALPKGVESVILVCHNSLTAI